MKTRDEWERASAPARAPSAGEAEAATRPELGVEPPQRRPEPEVTASLEPTLVDVASDLSFPASDPPCWTLGREAAPPTPEAAQPQPTPDTERLEHSELDHPEGYEEEDEELPAVARS